MTDRDAVARQAAHDVARLLDRRGLRELVALARRVRREARPHPNAHVRPKAGEPDGTGCTL
jgi:hypothetical protein